MTCINVQKREIQGFFPLFLEKGTQWVSDTSGSFQGKWYFYEHGINLSTGQCVWKGQAFLCLTKHHAVQKYG